MTDDAKAFDIGYLWNRAGAPAMHYCQQKCFGQTNLKSLY